MYIDTHCHLNDEAFINKEEEYLNKAHQAGVDIVFVVGWDLKSSIRAVELANRFNGVYAIIGLHPENIDSYSNDLWDQIRKLQKENRKVIAIGEIGLDFHWTKDLDIHRRQEEIFIQQIELANELKLPISVHSRDASARTLAILKEHPPVFKGVMHCYSGSLEMAKEFIKLGMDISFAGPVTFKNAHEPKEVAANIPSETLLVETDAPYLAPQPFRGTTNESKNIPFIVREIAQLRNLSNKEIEQIVMDNATRLFHVKQNG
jgi:TatD DNase family protein